MTVMSFVLGATVLVFCCILNFSLIVGLHSKTKFTEEPPDNVSATLGSTVTFTWKFSFGSSQDRNDLEQFYWGTTDNNEYIRNKYITIVNAVQWHVNPSLQQSIRSRIGWSGSIGRKRCTLKFTLINVVKSDEDTFGCTAVVFGDEIRSGPVQLIVLIPPTINNPKSNTRVDANVGDDVTLQCDVSGDPIPVVSWKKDGIILQSSNTTTVLQRPNIQLADTGIYTCTATNQAGSDSVSILVNVA